MAPEATRNNDRSSSTPHFTMKTSTRPPLGSSHSVHGSLPRHSQSNMQSFRSNRSSTPLASPRMPHSVGQAYPPAVKVSPIVNADARTPSPNYFGLSMDQHGDLGGSSDAPHNNWSPPNSSIKSFNTAIPKSMPLDANPDFEAFRRQIDANKSANGGFSLSNSYFAPSPAASRPRPLRKSTNQSNDAAHDGSMLKPPPSMKLRDPPGGRTDGDLNSPHDSAYVSSDSKRNSEASLHTSFFGGMARFESPKQTDSPLDGIHRSTMLKAEDRQSRLSLPCTTPDTITKGAQPRSETLPPGPDGQSLSLLLPSKLKDMLQDSPESEYLLLDLRVATLYSQSRIRSALNLCIPTTLLKRATYSLDKLEKTLQTEEDQTKFSEWADVEHLVLYDGASAEKRDAVSSANMFKKFVNEGFSGNAWLLKGGFNAFAAAYPSCIDHQSTAERGGTSAAGPQGGRPSFAPVIGGVSLPSTTNSANPFFGNIRQNMDLADGVGQMDISVPSNLDMDILPRWLKEAAKSADHGKKVSDRFLSIEKSEQSRMREAYSAFNQPLATHSNPEKVQLCGVEKGVKNRYKDILPFAHARVHLNKSDAGACDYINASHVQASRSHKRYIAAQGPLPATFEDFWSVVWDQDVRVVVMLTAEHEGGQLKCHPYWRGRDFGPLQLRPLSEKKVSLDMDKHKSNTVPSSNPANGSDSGRRRANTTTTLDVSSSSSSSKPGQSDEHVVIIRKFALSHSAHPFAPIREITHLHYPSWPDFGAPAKPSHLLALVELANVMQRAHLPLDASTVAASAAAEHPATMSWYDEPESDAEARPMLVHCSAGCGRTGTFCTVDSVIDMLKRQRLASIAKKHRTDTEGDVIMDEGSLSPESEARKKLRRAGTFTTSPGSIRGVEAGWVGDTALDLVSATVEDFRKQRLSMVQSLRQFVLCYESIVEWVSRLQERNNSRSPRSRRRSGSLQGPR
ncbi:hypothetical protein F5Y18DRAFT_28460 [Xylariaceae sp. FL1019]|nr:hypothetical protein F5Y18DRAFT_28460 [Xylariaceae sp. FL1019]